MNVDNTHSQTSASAVWLVQMERHNEHDADVVASELEALDMVIDPLRQSVDFVIEPAAFSACPDYREGVRARAGARGVFYTNERRQLTAH